MSNKPQKTKDDHLKKHCITAGQAYQRTLKNRKCGAGRAIDDVEERLSLAVDNGYFSIRVPFTSEILKGNPVFKHEDKCCKMYQACGGRFRTIDDYKPYLSDTMVELIEFFEKLGYKVSVFMINAMGRSGITLEFDWSASDQTV